MDSAKLIMILLLSSFLLFGCTEAEDDSVQLPNKTIVEEKNTSILTNPEPVQKAQVPKLPKDRAYQLGRAYEELAISGTPIKCTLLSASGSELVNATLYQKGYDYLRFTIPGQEPYELIMSGQKKFETNPQFGNSSNPKGEYKWIENESSMEEIFIFTQNLIPESCIEWEFDASVFAPPKTDKTYLISEELEKAFEGDISGKTFRELPATNRALHCKFTSGNSSEKLDYDIYLRGKNRLRAEIQSSGANSSNCTEWTYIMNSGIAYFGCASGCMYCKENYGNNELTKCIWEIRDLDSLDSLGDMSARQMNCQDWSYDESLFSPPAGQRVCTEEDIVRYTIESMK